jgi:hypothetical protein
MQGLQRMMKTGFAAVQQRFAVNKEAQRHEDRGSQRQTDR